jgi:hypothetical protein
MDLKFPPERTQARGYILKVFPGEALVPVILFLDSCWIGVFLDDFIPPRGRYGYLDVVSSHLLLIVTGNNGLEFNLCRFLFIRLTSSRQKSMTIQTEILKTSDAQILIIFKMQTKNWPVQIMHLGEAEMHDLNR